MAVLATGALAWAPGSAAALAPAADPHPPRAAGAQAAAAQSAVALAGATLVQQQQLAQAAQTWQQQLAGLAAEARRQGDGGLLIVITQVSGELQSVSLFPATVAGFVAALQASQNALALWRNHQPASGAEDQPEWQAAERGASDLTTAEETGFVLATDLTSGAAWRYVDGPDPGAPGSDAAAGPPAPDAAGGEGSPDGVMPEGPTQDGAAADEPGQGDVADIAGIAGDPAQAGTRGERTEAGLGGSRDQAGPGAERQSIGSNDGGDGVGVAADRQQAGSGADLSDLGDLTDLADLHGGQAPFVPNGAGTPESPGAGWIVVHGGPASDWSDETPSAGGDPAYVVQLGELDGTSPLDAAAEMGDAGEVSDLADLAGRGDSGSEGAPAALLAGFDGSAAVLSVAAVLPAGGPACRAWQPPATSAAACLLHLPLLGQF